MGKGGNNRHPPPPRRTSKKVLLPQTNNLISNVPPSNWLAAGGDRKNDYFYSKLPKFCCLSAAIKKFFKFCLSFPPLSPLRKAKLVPPLRVQKPLPPGRNLADPLPSCRPHAHLWVDRTYIFWTRFESSLVKIFLNRIEPKNFQLKLNEPYDISWKKSKQNIWRQSQCQHPFYLRR